MGKPSPFAADNEPLPSPNPEPTPLGESASAISLHTTASLSDPPITRYFDDDPSELDPDDLPPLYSDHGPGVGEGQGYGNGGEEGGYFNFDSRRGQRRGGRGQGRGPVADPLIPREAQGLEIEPFKVDSQKETTYYVDKRLTTDPVFLQDQLTKLSHIPPRPFVHIRGTHTETIKRGDKSERNQVVDFDLQIELTHLLFEDVRTQRSWRKLLTAGNFEKVRRGTVFATRAPGFGGGSGAAVEDGQPSLEMWCHRFCASSFGLKNFVFERRVVGFDTNGTLEGKLKSLVRSTNYKGNVSVTFPIHNARVEIYNDCRTNRWRLTKWIEVLFVFTLMFLFAWPWLFFRTRRWETVYAAWSTSCVDKDPNNPDGALRKRYAAMSEDRWYNMWARAVAKAVVDRRQGMMDQGDLQRAEGQPPREEGFVGAVQAGIEAMGVVNRSFGWGGDTA